MVRGITILQTVTSALAAYAFARLRFRGRDLLFLLYLGTLMIPPQVTVIPQFILAKELDWVDTYQGLIVPQAFTAFGVFLLRQFFLTIPYELEDAARIDGASRFGCFWRIILPLSGPALATLAVFAFLFHWNNLLWPLIVSNSDATIPVVVGLRTRASTDRVEPAHGRRRHRHHPDRYRVPVRPALVRAGNNHVRFRRQVANNVTDKEEP